MPEIPEMFPSQKQQEAKTRHHSQKIAESFKETQKESIFNLMCSKSLLLYGNASVMHMREDGGQSRRMEIPMQRHSISMEIPRQGDIDPFTFDYTLRVFRNERIVSR
jgi:phage portal protein BeeE